MAFTLREMERLCKILSGGVKRSELIFKRDSCVRQKSKNFIYDFRILGSGVIRLDHCIRNRLEVSKPTVGFDYEKKLVLNLAPWTRLDRLLGKESCL